MDQPSTRSRKGWWFTAGLLTAVTLLGLRFAIPYYRTRAAIMAVERAGGSVVLHDHLPESLIKIAGFDGTSPIHDVRVVNLTDCSPEEFESILQRLDDLPALYAITVQSITDDQMRYVGRLANLRGLFISRSTVSGEGFAHLLNLQDLEWLSVERSEITGDGLRRIASLAKLQMLSMNRTRFATSELHHLSRLRKLFSLSLDATDVGDEEMRHFRDAPLGILNLRRTRITDETLNQFSTCGTLQSLDLTSCAITDRGLAYLFGAANLETLVLTGTKITDDGLPALKSLKKLLLLVLQNTAVTDKGCDDLCNSLPFVRIARPGKSFGSCSLPE